MEFGIDVSSCNGSIDWAKVVKENPNLKFVVLRATTRNNKMDEKLIFNYQNAKKYGLLVGYYKFSYAMSLDDAKKESKAVLDICKNYPPDLGVWYDMEWNEQRNKVSKSAITNIINTFAFSIRLNKIPVGIYCSEDWYKNVLDTYSLINNHRYIFWIAKYGKNDMAIPQGKYDITDKYQNCVAWQYCSKGIVAGINSAVDLDLFWNNPSDVLRFCYPEYYR